MRELVLGAEGLIGRELVGELQRRGHDVISCDRATGCDARELPHEAFASADRVWFLAWDAGGSKYMSAKERQHRTYRENCELAIRVFDALAATGTPFLFATSQLAGQRTAYGLTKLMAETWAAELGGKRARLWNVYGWERPGIRSHVVTDLVLSGLTGARVTCVTNGEERRRLLHKRDCIAALIELFDGPLPVADVAGPEWISIRQVAEEIARQLGVSVALGSESGDEVLVDPQWLLPNWRASVSLTEGVATVIDEGRQFLRSSMPAASARSG